MLCNGIHYSKMTDEWIALSFTNKLQLEQIQMPLSKGLTLSNYKYVICRALQDYIGT